MTDNQHHTLGDNMKITRDNWIKVDLTCIVLRRNPKFMSVVIIPVCDPEGGQHWMRFDHQIMKWATVDVNDVCDEVDQAWSDPRCKVKVITEDLPQEGPNQFNPFSVL